jgi:hypothetical protein
MRIEAIDLFCGIGGLTYGLKTAGITEIMSGSMVLIPRKKCSIIFHLISFSLFLTLKVWDENGFQRKKGGGDVSLYGIWAGSTHEWVPPLLHWFFWGD